MSVEECGLLIVVEKHSLLCLLTIGTGCEGLRVDFFVLRQEVHKIAIIHHLRILKWYDDLHLVLEDSECLEEAMALPHEGPNHTIIVVLDP